MSAVLRRTLLAVLVAGLFLPWRALAQPQYPSEPIKLIVPYAPGGVPDTTARLLAQKLQDRVGQTVVVENRAGGNGSVAAGVIAAAPADGTRSSSSTPRCSPSARCSSASSPTIRRRISCRSRRWRARRCFSR